MDSFDLQQNHLITTIAGRRFLAFFDGLNKEVYVNTPNECTSRVLIICLLSLIYAPQQHAEVFVYFFPPFLKKYKLQRRRSKIMLAMVAKQKSLNASACHLLDVLLRFSLVG